MDRAVSKIMPGPPDASSCEPRASLAKVFRSRVEPSASR